MQSKLIYLLTKRSSIPIADILSHFKNQFHKKQVNHVSELTINVITMGVCREKGSTFPCCKIKIDQTWCNELKQQKCYRLMSSTDIVIILSVIHLSPIHWSISAIIRVFQYSKKLVLNLISGQNMLKNTLFFFKRRISHYTFTPPDHNLQIFRTLTNPQKKIDLSWIFSADALGDNDSRIWLNVINKFSIQSTLQFGV